MAERDTSEQRKLVVTLSENALLEHGKEQSAKLLRIVELELDRTKINNEIKPLKERVAELARAIDTGEEVQDVMVDWDFDWDKGLKSCFRSDTGAQVGEPVRIEDWERQEHQRLF